MYLSVFDRATIAAHRATLERGLKGTTGDVRAELAERGIPLKCSDLGKHVAWLREQYLIPMLPCVCGRLALPRPQYLNKCAPCFNGPEFRVVNHDGHVSR